MIVPTGRLIALVAAGAPLALLVGIVVPAAWPVALAWLAVAVAAAVFDAAATPGPVGATLSLPRTINLGEDFAIGVGLAAPLRVGRVEVALAGDPRLALAGGGRAAARLGGGVGVAAITATSRRRGTVRLDRLDLRWRGPLGLVARQRRQRGDRTVEIVPDIRAVHTDGVALLAADARAGQVAQFAVGSGGEFDALADFRRGMDRRQIDWKQSARHAGLLAKEYRTERDTNVVLAFDCGRTMCEPLAGLPRIDRAVSAGLLTAYVSLRLGDRVGLFGFDARPRLAAAAQAGRGAFARLQGLAARLDYSAEETNFTLGLSTLAQRLDRRSLIILFTDFVDTVGAELMLRALGRLLERHVLLCVVLRDDELEARARAEPVVADDVTRAVIAAGLLRERRIVLTRLRRMGIEVLEAPWQEVGPALARRYLDIKRRQRV